MVAVQKFHTKQKKFSSNNYPHFIVGRGYGTTDCKNNASSLSLVPCKNHYPEIPVSQATPKNSTFKFNVQTQLSNLKEKTGLSTKSKTTALN